MADMPHGLPYIDHPDEPNFYALANDVRGVRDAYWRNDWLEGYPPGYILLYAMILNGVDAIAANNTDTDMGMYVGTLRIVSILIDMLTLALMLLAVRWLAGKHASLLAGGIWAISAAVVQNAILALPDPPTVFACVLCVVLALKAFRQQAFLWAILATIAGLVATLFKYPVAPILLLPAAFCLWQLRRDLRRALLPSALALALVLLTAYGLFFIYGANNLSNVEANTVRSSFVTNMLDAFRWYKVFNGLFGTIGIGLLAVMGIAAFLAAKQYFGVKNHVLGKARLTPTMMLIGLTAINGFSILAIIPGYLHSYANSIYPIRYTLSAAALLLIAAAAWIGQQEFTPNKLHPTSKTRLALMRWHFFLIVPILALLPETIAYQTYMQRPFTYTAMQRWFEANIPTNTRLWTTHIDAYVSLSRYERGYSGFKDFNVVFAPNNVAENGLTTADMEYLYLTEDDLYLFPDSLHPLVKHIGGYPYREPDLYILRAHPLPHPQTTIFSNSTTQLMLRGIQTHKTPAQMTAETFWQAPILPDKIYSYSLYLTPTDDPSQSLAQMDGQLGQRPTHTWDDPQELLRGDMQPLTLPELASGDYTVWLVLYSWETAERFVLENGQDRLPVLAFTIADATHQDRASTLSFG